MSANNGDDDDPPPIDTQLDRLEVPDSVRKSVMKYYHDHRDFYAEPWRNLDETRRIFLGDDQELRTSLLVLSYVYAVFTTRTQIEEAEEHFRRVYQDGEPVAFVMDTSGNIDGKGEFINRSLDHYGYVGFTEFGNQLAAGEVEPVVDKFEDGFLLNIGPIKAPFMVSQLGFTAKMCIDSNMQDFLGLEINSPSNDEIRMICAEVKDLFPDVYDEVEEAYHLQWILFNYQRINNVYWNPDEYPLKLDIMGRTPITRLEGKEPEKHAEWFRATLDDPERIKDRVHEMFVATGKAEIGLPSRM